MQEEQIHKLIAEALQVDVSSLDSSVNYRDTTWDSLADIIFIGLVDDAIGKTIDPEALASCNYVEDFVRLVQKD